MFKLHDIFIGDHNLIEQFGENPDVYIARYNIQGYPGVRFRMPTLTPILAGADGFVSKVDFEEAGKGKYIELQHGNFLTTYGHLNDYMVQEGEKVVAGQLIAHSNQSGLADTPCLYFGIAPTDQAGTKIRDNGYGGFIDPMGDEVEWDVKNIKEPVTKADVIDDMKLTSREYSILNAQATNYRVFLSFLQNHTTFDEFLKEKGHVPVNLTLTPDDSTGGEAVILYLTEMADQFEEQNAEIEKLKNAVPVVPQLNPTIPVVKKDSFLVKLRNATKAFIFAS